MCSVFGGEIGDIVEDFREANRALRHRGTNFSGEFVESEVGLFHNRLSIIDLDSEANQPFISPKYPHLVLIFNGEIYNYLELKEELAKEGVEFSTTSDTEVLLAMYVKYGKDSLRYLNGDFAFVVFDKRDKSFFLARDRLGNKPLFYSLKNNRLLFASEIKALLKVLGVEFDRDEVSKWLLFSNGSNGKTIYKEIFEFPKAHFGVYKSGKLYLERYWDLRIDNRICDESLALEELESLLCDSLYLRMRSDVPLSMSVSGGIDSTLLAYMAKNLGRSCEFFGLSFDGFDDYSEGEYIRKLEDSLKINVNIINANLESIRDDFRNLVFAQDEIFRSFSIYAQFLLFKEVSKTHKVIIGGQGADECFGGYYHHIGRYIFKNKEEFEKRVNLYGKEALDEYTFGLKCSLDDKLKLKLFKEDNEHGIKKLQKLGFNPPSFEPLLDRFKESFDEGLLLDVLYFNLPNLLRYEDRNSMFFSLENRTPFTDYRLVEFAFRLDSSLKFKNGYSKYILRKLLSKYSLDEFAWRLDKKGFVAPESFCYSKLFGVSGNLFDIRLAIFRELEKRV